MIIYFNLPYFHVSNSALFFSNCSCVLSFHRLSFDTIYSNTFCSMRISALKFDPFGIKLKLILVSFFKQRWHNLLPHKCIIRFRWFQQKCMRDLFKPTTIFKIYSYSTLILYVATIMHQHRVVMCIYTHDISSEKYHIGIKYFPQCVLRLHEVLLHTRQYTIVEHLCRCLTHSNQCIHTMETNIC